MENQEESDTDDSVVDKDYEPSSNECDEEGDILGNKLYFSSVYRLILQILRLR